MKRKIFLLTIVLVLVTFIFAQARPLPAQAADSAPPRSITVTGDADVKVVPDEVGLYLGVETWDKELLAAKKQNDDRVKQVLAYAKNFGIDAKYIQTDQMSVEPRYEDSYAKRNFLAYYVRKSLTITLKDIAKFEDLLAGVLGAGATNIHGIQYRTTELRTHRDTARSLALKAAQEKATAMAKDLGMKVGKAANVREDSTSWWSPYNSYWWGGNAMSQNVTQNASTSGAPLSDGTISLGQITVNARVTVTFDLE